MQKINFVDLPSTTTPISAENLNAIQTNTENAISELNNVELIAVSNTAPSTCSTGDKYYNTSTKKIYTATGTNTWGSTGANAVSGILYIVYEDQASYSWDGNDLVSVGGGKEDIVISDTEPTDPDVKIWIDTGEVQNLGSEVHIGTEVDSKVGLNILYSRNLLNPQLAQAGVNWSGANNSGRGRFVLDKAGTYTISCQSLGSVTSALVLIANSAFTSIVSQQDITTSSTITYTISEGQHLVIQYSKTSITLDDIASAKIQIELGNGKTAYHDYMTPAINVNGEDIYVKGQNEVYSTQEQRIGTWINGKPLYRKTFYITSNLSSPLDIQHNIQNVDYMKVEGHLTTSTTSTPPFYATTTDYFRVFRNQNLLSARYGTGITASSITFIVEYTKTTD